MRTLLLSLLLVIGLGGCSTLVHKNDVEQGNLITQDMLAKLHVGMTKDQVVELLGPPVLSNAYDKNRLDYAYSFKPAHGETSQKSMTLIFKNGRLSEITGNMYSTFINK